MGDAALGQWKAGVSVFLRASSVVFPGKRGQIKVITNKGQPHLCDIL